MIKVSRNFYSTIALFFVFLSLLGYSLVTSIFLPLTSDDSSMSQVVTYPYRAVVFALSVFLILTRPSFSEAMRMGKLLRLYVLFMSVYFSRIFIDIFFVNVYVEPGFKTTVVQYLFLSVIPAMLAMYRCARYVNYNSLNRWLLYGSMAFLVIAIMNQNSLVEFEYEEMRRESGNIAMGSLNLGYTCVVCFVIIFLNLIQSEHKFWGKTIIEVLFSVLSLVIMLRAASRGPLVAFLFLILFLYFIKSNNKIFGLLVTLLMLLLIWTNSSWMLDFIGNISPMMGQRMEATIIDGDSSGRDSLYAEAFSLFFDNPIFGKQFVLNDGFYAHNSILDVMIALGVFGVVVWVYLIWKDVKLTYQNISNKSCISVISMISILYILQSFFSGAMYINSKLAICLMIVFSVSEKPENA